MDVTRFAICQTHIAKTIVPILIVLGLGYLNYACGYALGYKEIYRYHSHAVAIVFWIILGILQLNVFLYWGLIVFIGPGKSPRFPPLDIYETNTSFEQDQVLIPVPDLFFCDESGYPYYDSHTESIKIERSFYSKDMGYNVIKFDHYCVWIGCSLGQTNYEFFMKYMIWFLVLFFYVVIFMACYTRSSMSHGTIDHNFIAIFVLSGFWIIMIAALFIAHVRYINRNITTLDDITIKQRESYLRWSARQNPDQIDQPKKPQGGFVAWLLKDKPPPRFETGKRYVNVKIDKFSRKVVEYSVDQQYPFDLGFKKNWINLMFNGNRNQGLPESYYTNLRLFLAFYALVVPYLDIPLFLTARGKQMDEIGREPDQEQGKREYLIRLYQSYSSHISENFRAYIDDKIAKNECQLPSYMTKELNSIES
ncbi:Palmitoyltransferase PFA5 [Spathaspora sp. JA1]|nr:Palmitoyltransferase PFA5 [Spathaspora sp. JA1]